MKIFSLCILLSSLFVYNSMGAIDEIALEGLSLVLNLTKNIQVKANERGGGDPRSLSGHFPAFHWVLRDFSLQPKNAAGQDIHAREYLDNCLSSDPNGNESKNKIRSTVRDLFKVRDCTFLIRPVGDERALQNLNTQPYESLREPFRRQMDQLTKQIYTSLKPKTMGNNSLLTGPMLAQLCEEYCDAMNKQAIPSIHSAWAAVVAEQLRRVSKQAALHYRKEMNEAALTHLPLDVEELRKVHKQKKKEALDLFQSHFLDLVNERQLSAVKPIIANLWSAAQVENADASRQDCEKAAQQVLERARAVTRANRAEQSPQLLNDYLKLARGPAREQVLAKTVVPQLLALLRAAHEEEVAALTQRLADAKQGVLDLHNALQLQKDCHASDATDVARKLQLEHEAQRAQWRLELEELKQEQQLEQGKLERERAQAEDQQRALTEQVKMLQERLQQQGGAPASNARLSGGAVPRDAAGLAESVNRALEELKAVDMDRRDLKQRNEHEKQLIGLERRFNQKMTDARRESEAKMEALRREYERELENLKSVNRDLQVQAARQEAELQKRTAALEQVRSLETVTMRQTQLLGFQRQLAEAMVEAFQRKDTSEIMGLLEDSNFR